MPARCSAPPALRVALLVLAATLAACDTSEPDRPAGPDLLGQLSTRTPFETFVEAADDTDLGALLASGGPYTVFAPTETAFAYLGDDFRSVLFDPAQRGVLARVLRHHVVAGRVVASGLADGDTLTSVDGRPLAVRRLGPVLEVGGVRVSPADSVAGDNGVAYAAADVMLGALATAERVRLSPSLTTFERLADRTGALPPAGVPAAGRVTILAPLDEGFAALGAGRLSLLQVNTNDPVLRRTVRSHVLPGTPAFVPGATLTALDGDPLAVRSDNGQLPIGGRAVLRVEDTADGRLVLLGGVMLETLTLGERLRIEPLMQSYWQQVRDADPALWTRLNDPSDQLTVFVPTDDAFGALGEPVVVSLGEPVNQPLARRVLRVHAVEGRFPPEAMVDGALLPTADGDALRVEFALGQWRYDGRPYRDAEAPAVRNGWFYELGSVALPRVDGLDTAILRGYTTHARAVRRAGLETVFRSPGLTAFVLSNAAYINTPQLIARPDLADILRYNATFTPLPEPGPATFTVLSGETRTVALFSCLGPGCTPYVIDDSLFVTRVGPSLDRTGYLHSLDVFAEPPPRRRP